MGFNGLKWVYMGLARISAAFTPEFTGPFFPCSELAPLWISL
jgi:hypothetical protein